MEKTPLYIAFVDQQLLESGRLVEVALAVKKHSGRKNAAQVLIFEHITSAQVDLDLSGTPKQVAARYDEQPKQPDSKTTEKRGRGRPKLGVVGSEVTLLPRHWEWLQSQPGGASVTLRKLVEQARRDNKDIDQIRDSRTSINRFMSAIGGDLPGFEEANRALFAGDQRRFNFEIELWPEDIKHHIDQLAVHAFSNTETSDPK